MAVHLNIRLFIGAAIGCLLSACAAESKLARQDIETFCTEQNGYQLGIEGAAYVNVCPDVLAPAFLDGYQSGYAVHLAQMEVDALERAIEAMSNELAEVCGALGDSRMESERSELMQRKDSLGAQLDELESEVGFRKTQLLQMRHSIAANN